MSYYYDLVNQRFCTHLFTKCTIEMVAIYLNSDLLFCTHKSLTKRGVAVVQDCYHECVAHLRKYKDRKYIQYAGKIVGCKYYKWRRVVFYQSMDTVPNHGHRDNP